MGTLQTVLELAEAGIALAAVGSMLIASTIHFLCFDEEPWAKPFLSAANDIVGFYKARKAAKDAKRDQT